MATSVILHSEEHGSFYWIIISGISLGPSIGEGSHVTCFQRHHWRIPSYQSKKQSTRGTMESPKLLLNGSVTCWHHFSSVATRHGAMATFSVTIWHMLFPPTLEKARKDASELHPSCKVTIVYLCNVQGISEGRKTKKILLARTYIVTCDLLRCLALACLPNKSLRKARAQIEKCNTTYRSQISFLIQRYAVLLYAFLEKKKRDHNSQHVHVLAQPHAADTCWGRLLADLISYQMGFGLICNWMRPFSKKKWMRGWTMRLAFSQVTVMLAQKGHGHLQINALFSLF